MTMPISDRPPAEGPGVTMAPIHMDARYRLADGVAIRQERFGGLVYHYHSRQLFFLHSPLLTALLEGLAPERTLRQAMDGLAARMVLPPDAGAALVATLVPALARLQGLGIVVEAGCPPTPPLS